MKENEVSKSNKIKIIVITALIFLVSIAGISYAYFTINIVGNDTASSMRLRTANMQLVYNDVQIVSGEYATPGWTDTKTLTVTNTGNVNANYTIIWRDLINEVTNGELVISAECSSTPTGSCADLDETVVPTNLSEVHNVRVKSNISIGPGETHTYTLTALFKETGSNQNYNQNKYFNGTLNIEEYEAPFTLVGTDSTTGLPVVRIGTEEFYDLTNAINYSSLISSNGNIYNYAAGKSILLARYNLYVGRIYSGGSYNVISSSNPNYGLQSASAQAGATSPAVGVVPFCGSSNANGYWYTGSGLNSQYGSSYDGSNVYDSTKVTAPNWSVAFQSNAGNANYSIAYYVEEYVSKLGIDGTGRLLTYTEADALDSKRDNGQNYWLGTAYSNNSLMDGGGGFAYPVVNFYNPSNGGVRPVIVVNTSDIQSN